MSFEASVEQVSETALPLSIDHDDEGQPNVIWRCKSVDEWGTRKQG